MSEELNAAIYLVGQGTYYSPRLIEVQFYQIIRYMQLVEGKGQEYFHVKKTLVDLNPRCWRSDPPSYEDLPQLNSLCDAVKRGEFSTIFIDLVHEGAMGSIERELIKSGAHVINVFYDKTVLRDAFSKRFGVSRELHSDVSDFVTFFPNIAGDIGEILAENIKADKHDSLKRRVDILQKEQARAGQCYDHHLLPFWQENELLDQREGK